MASAALDRVQEAYRLLGIELGPGDAGSSIDEAAIKKAYREMSRKTHPDKNPDDPKAGEKFDAVNKAYETLMDATLRAQFATKLAAKQASVQRFKELDAQRQKLRADLEAREKRASGAAQQTRKPHAGAAAPPMAPPSVRPTTAAGKPSGIEDKIARLRREGQELLAQEEESRRAKRRQEPGISAATAAQAETEPVFVMEEDEEEGHVAAEPASAVGQEEGAAFRLDATVRLKWSKELSDAVGTEPISAAMESDDGLPAKTFSEDQIEGIARPFGKVLAVISRKPLSACVVMENKEAVRAMVAAPPQGFKVKPMVALSTTGPPSSASSSSVGVGIKRPRPTDDHQTVGGDDDNSASAAAAGRSSALLQQGRPLTLDADGVSRPTEAQNASFAKKEREVLGRLHRFAMALT
jgi:curved DNA-binding protein CbpA